MNRKRVDIIWLGVSVFFFALLAISFLLMPLGNETQTESISIYALVIGLLFWISLIMGVVTQCVLAHRRKMWYVIHHVRKARTSQKIGLVSFFKNAYASVFDIIAILSLIGLIIAVILTQGIGYVCYILISLFVFSFSMHCVFNGKIFFHIINQNRMLQILEKERSNSSK